jgi:uncharacterized RDD family membrane protein YckC
MPSARPEIASQSNRVVAYAFDVVMVGIAYWFVAYAAAELGHAVDDALTFALLYFAYQLSFLRWNDGVTFGKSLRGICVISAAGAPLTAGQAVVRAAIAALPFALLIERDLLAALLGSFPDARYLATLPSLLWWLAELYFAESDELRRSLTDRIAKSLVVNVPPPQPHRAPAAPMYSATDAEFGPRPKHGPHGGGADSEA